jgi:hypothetical protein
MTKETIGLIDTAIKIGLGALIASISSYLITRFNHRSDEKKEFIKRYISSIDRISDSADEYFQKWTILINAIAGTSKSSIEKEIVPNENQWAYVRKRDAEFIESRKNKMTAISRLKLLGLNDVGNILEETTKIEKELREIIVFKKELPTVKEVYSFGERMNIQRELFYKTLSKYYVTYKIPAHNNGCS